ncbi:hypothetical protein RHGRI_012720 [Rhododendron griersonianum]|uniref:Jacalin-type lectin domain-containing protein n=1 Tax=Rhododendron griersonianum TaxID=479676 RepID=A0AAV6KRL4_9ERIC|nr:hypothetical protein RHGRI_012720 [Rhododendron griersonianum]
MIKIGPAGVTDFGKAWDDGGKEKIVQIFIAHEDFIYSLQFLYVDQTGNLVLSDLHGGGFATSKFDVVKLDYPSEFITGISGCHGHVRCCRKKQILSITFTTNNRTYGPFGGCGGENDSSFRYQLGLDRPFGGFHGYSGNYVHAIGLYVKPMTTLSNVQEKVTLDYPSESLTGITGCYGWRNLVDGMYLNSIGVYVKPWTSVLDLDKAKIASGGGAAVAFSGPAAGGVAAAAAPAAAAVEEKKEEPKEESDDDMGFSLFD